MKKIGLVVFSALIITSCVSKKKFDQTENLLMVAESRLSKAQNEKSECAEENEELQATVESYYQKIYELQKENENRIGLNPDGTLVTAESMQNMRRVLQNVDPEKLAQAQTLNDSINLAIAYNIKQSFVETITEVDEDGNEVQRTTVAPEMEGLEVQVNHPVVRISIQNSILYSSGSSWVTAKSFPLIERLSGIIKSEPSMEVLVEGHADTMPVVEGSYLEDNWMMGSRRAVAVVRVMENKYGVNGEQLIASSRSHFKPVAENTTPEGRSQNRRTTITLMPNMEKFMQLMK